MGQPSAGLVPPRGSPPNATLWRGLAIALVAIAVVELVLRVLLDVPTLTALAAVVAYISFSYGRRVGLLGAAVMSAYGVYYFSTPDRLFEYTRDNLVRLATLPPTLVVVALIVGSLRRSLDSSIQELRRQRDFSRALDESLGDGVYALDAEGTVTYANPAAERMLGWTEDELLGMVMHDTIHYKREDGSPFPREECKGLVEVVSRGVTVRNDDVFIRKDGRMFPVTYTSSPITMDGRLIGAVVAFRDISERRRAQERLLLQYEVSRVLARATDLRDAAPGVLAAMGQRLGWDHGALWTVEPAGDALRCAHTWEAEQRSFPSPAAPRRTQLAPGEGLPGAVWQSGEARWMEDGTAEPGFPRLGVTSSEGLSYGFGLPIKLDGRVVAVIELLSREPRERDPDLLDVAESLGVQICQFMERERAEEELRRSRERKATILETALDAIVTIDHEGRIVEFNPAAERVFGYPREQVPGRQIAELIIPPSLRDAHYRGLAHYLSTGEGPILGQRIELTAMKADGTEFPVELAVTSIPSHEPPMFTGYIRDITDRKRAEEELRQAEEKYRGIFENAVEGIFQSTVDGRILTANPALARILGYESPEELLTAVDDVRRKLYVDPGRREELARLLARQGAVSGFEVQVYRQDGEVIWTRSNIRAARSASGDVTGLEGTVEDVTARKRGERLLATQYEVSRVLAEARSLEEAAPRVLAAIGEGLDWHYGALWIVDRGADVLRCVETWHADGVDLERFIAESRRSAFRPGKGLPGTVWEACQPRWVVDASAERNFPRLAVASSEGLRSGFGLPIVLSERVVAVIEFLSREARRQEDDTLAAMAALGRQTGQFVERVRAEAEVRRSEERLRLLVEGAKDYAMMMLSPEGCIESWNAGAERLYGYTEEEAMGRHLSMLYTPEDRAADVPERELRRAVEEGRASDENRAVRKDGTRFWANGVITPLWDERGQLRGLSKVARDITWRKLTEEALEARARQQAAVAELGRRAIAERDPAILMGEAVSLVVEVLGVEYCKVLELLPGGEELRLVAGVGWSEGLVGEATVGAGQDSQAGYTLTSQGPVIVRDLATETRFSGPPLLRDHGVVSGLSAVIGGQDGPFGVLGAHTRERREFTPDDANFLQAVANVLATAIRRRQFEDRLASERAEAERLEELDRLRREFVSSVSHELRTPLTAIRSGLGLIEASSADRLRPDELRLLESARRNNERLRILIDGLLAYNQLEAGTLELERFPLDLREVAADAIGTVQLLLEEKGQLLEMDLPDALPVEGDRFRLGQVVINLLANAWEHTPRGTRITMSGRAQGREVMLAVSDDGLGISPDNLQLIFERSRRLDRSPGGSGLGLAIARGIVELHGGRIWAESEPRRGATFRFVLPRNEMWYRADAQDQLRPT